MAVIRIALISLALCIVLLDCCSKVHATKSYYYPPKEYKKDYGFHYNTDDGYGNTAHRSEYTDPYDGSVKGSYGYWNADGVYRTVYYTADEGGFRANIKTNEPGTDNQNPADVKVTALKPPPPPPKYYSPPPKPSYPPPSYSYPQQKSYPPAYPPKYSYPQPYPPPKYSYPEPYPPPKYSYPQPYPPPKYSYPQPYPPPKYSYPQPYPPPKYSYPQPYPPPKYSYPQPYPPPSYSYPPQTYKPPTYPAQYPPPPKYSPPPKMYPSPPPSAPQTRHPHPARYSHPAPMTTQAPSPPENMPPPSAPQTVEKEIEGMTPPENSEAAVAIPMRPERHQQQSPRFGQRLTRPKLRTMMTTPSPPPQEFLERFETLDGLPEEIFELEI